MFALTLKYDFRVSVLNPLSTSVTRFWSYPSQMMYVTKWFKRREDLTFLGNRPRKLQSARSACDVSVFACVESLLFIFDGWALSFESPFFHFRFERRLCRISQAVYGFKLLEYVYDHNFTGSFHILIFSLSIAWLDQIFRNEWLIASARKNP